MRQKFKKWLYIMVGISILQTLPLFVFSADADNTQCTSCESCCKEKQKNVYEQCIKSFAKDLCDGTALTAYNSCNNDCPLEKK